ncbi:hypothetical protein GCM10010954_03000 [Halobacillus andaensis]|uniref:Resolvase HTH domain-containing protein n=1 Tax=Halobacillus andaensis TaxID=1176239 RepID=A0A917EUN1_HALAA|nr:hypothetical protein [Halobacillus andaensis]MBP2003089.1 arsenate reductase-like glutaredoxin family protein [Halobacillus andaensis]GGF07905.1 hypothetical protein GCM10010954_03000 [Halobacillus andaensis]
MIPILITLAAISVVLFIASFFMNDRLKDVEDQVEQLSIQVMQDTYQVKKKLNVLEEELLTGDLTEEMIKHPRSSSSQHPPLAQTIRSMYQGGYSTERIAKETNMSVSDVQNIVHSYAAEGVPQ